jgi:hypothetical protein
VGALYVPYVYPQENGGRTDTSWLTISGGPGPALAFVCTSNAAASGPAAAAPGARAARPALALFTVARHGWRAVQEARRPYRLDECERAAAAAEAAARAAGAAAAAAAAAAAPESPSAVADASGGAAAAVEGDAPPDAPPDEPAMLHVHLDAAHMGVGGDDSWSPSVHDAYLVPPGEYSFGVALLPLPLPGPRGT